MKRRELFWMLVPCLLLIVAGVWLRGREKDVKPKRTDFRVELEEVKLIPPTPREVALDYDTVVLAKARMQGPRALDFTDETVYNYPFSIQVEVWDTKDNRVPVESAGG